MIVIHRYVPSLRMERRKNFPRSGIGDLASAVSIFEERLLDDVHSEQWWVPWALAILLSLFVARCALKCCKPSVRQPCLSPQDQGELEENNPMLPFSQICSTMVCWWNVRNVHCNLCARWRNFFQGHALSMHEQWQTHSLSLVDLLHFALHGPLVF